MTQKNTEGIAGALPGVTYFVQDLRDWHNNFPGKNSLVFIRFNLPFSANKPKN